MTSEHLAAAILRDVPRYEPDNPPDNAPSMKPVGDGDWLSYNDVLAALTRALSGDLIERAGAVLEGVTDGPWAYRQDKEGDFAITRPDGLVVLEILNVDDQSEPDARFIAAARELVPALLARNAALTVERDEHRGNWERAFNANTALEARAEAAEAEVARAREGLRRIIAAGAIQVTNETTGKRLPDIDSPAGAIARALLNELDEARILAALEPVSAPDPATIREAALREALAVIDGMAALPMTENSYCSACDDARAGILALIPKGAADDRA